ncbi:uncharacterized protein LOC123317359 [Coccinella septempunctata]|uniref:uncharacterized protein LOC123317359 n=1 Tax=Coccinella septempunctata TaxID=41139 RepID=UPI001D07E421|nr:uncharacterized protein LOC123317359 [Coccinella septempunctata]
MEKYLNLIFLLSCSTVLANPVQLRDVAPVKECTKAGMMCESCSTSVMCVKIGNEFQKVNRMTCATGSSCLGGTCTKEVNPPCDYATVDFPCQYQGAYPHPGDWSKFVYCIPDATGVFTAYSVNCEPGTGYNAKTTYCSRNLTTISPTVFPIARCLSPSTTPLAHPDNPSIYYICSQTTGTDKLYPIQFTCPSGGTFANGECSIVLSDESKKTLI